MYYCFLLFNCRVSLTIKILFNYQAFYIQDAGGVTNSFVQLMSTTAKEELLCKQRERLKIYAWQKAGNALHDVYLKVKAQGGRAKR